MPSFASALVMVNPKSRGDLPEGWQTRLASAGIDARIEEPDSPAAMRQLIERAGSQRDVDCLVIAGGDGTLHQALPALLDVRLPLAVIPIGTANDLARTLELPEDLLAAFDVVARGVPRPVDVGVANGVPFLNAANLGVGVRVNRGLDGDTKKLWGALSYLRSAWHAVDEQRPFDVDIVCDGEQQRIRCVHVAVGNGVFYGGGARIAEDASIADGWLDLYTLPPRGALQLAALVPWLRSGTQGRWREVHNLRGRRIRLQTSRPLEVFADGERVARTPVEFSVRPGALDVLVPAPKQTGDESVLRDEREVSLNRLLVASRALAESYAGLRKPLDSDDASAARLFATLAEERSRAADELERHVRGLEELPAAPDPERQLLSLLSSRAKGAFSADRTRALAEDRAAAERDLAACAESALEQDLSAATRALLQSVATDSQRAQERLAALAAEHQN